MIDPTLAFVFVAGLIFYFVPALVAAGRRHRNANAILVTNLVLGWTLLGWAIALIWAFTAGREARSRSAAA